LIARWIRTQSPRLRSIKRDHEEKGIVEIILLAAHVVKRLEANYGEDSIVGRRGNVAILSPGATQELTVNFDNTIKSSESQRVASQRLTPSIGAPQPKVADCRHLVNQYSDYQKADATGEGRYKFIAIYHSLSESWAWSGSYSAKIVLTRP
jgi:hypothetical protein